MTRVQKLTLTTLVAGYLLIVLGGVVRVDARFGCGVDWPLCRGALLPAGAGTATVINLGHRVLGAGVALLTLALLAAAWRRRDRPALLLSGAAAMLVAAQVALGALVATRDLPATLLAAHLGLGQLYLAAIVVLTLLAFAPEIARASGRTLGHAFSRFGPVALVASGAVLVLLVSGAYTAAEPANACSGWPLCDGRVVPTGFSALDIELLHRWAALLASVAVVAALIQARRVRRDAPVLVAATTAAAVLVASQIMVGAASVWFRLNDALLIAHLAVATVVLLLLVATTVLDRLLPVVAAERAAPRGWRVVGSDYLTLTKPNVMVLLLITTLGAMLIAQGGLPPLGIIWWTLVGGALSSGGAAAFNHYLDRDIDAVMKRTRNRPLPGKRIPPIHVPIFGLTLTVLAVYLLAVFVNPLAALLSLAGNLFYVLVYTKVLKRSTPQNIVIGGAAGAVPPLVGWAAVTGQVGLPAMLLFGVIFYWTPPHFWSLALFTSSDYAAAQVPMFPEVYGDEETRRHIFLYTVMLVITTLFFFAIRVMGLFYLACALILGALFLYKAYRLTRHPAGQKLLARSLFFYSVWYLGLLYAAMVVDRVFFRYGF